MTRLLETIYFLNGEPQNLAYHNFRFNDSRVNVFGMVNFIDLAPLLIPPVEATVGEYRCRILYRGDIEEIQWLKYERKKPYTFQLVNNPLEYKYKWEHRDFINDMVAEKAMADDIIMVRASTQEITDSSYANLVFQKNGQYFTPQNPLLEGTKRRKLLVDNQLKLEVITLENYKTFESFAIINAFNDLKPHSFLPISNILP